MSTLSKVEYMQKKQKEKNEFDIAYSQGMLWDLDCVIDIMAASENIHKRLGFAKAVKQRISELEKSNPPDIHIRPAKLSDDK